MMEAAGSATATTMEAAGSAAGAVATLAGFSMMGLDFFVSRALRLGGGVLAVLSAPAVSPVVVARNGRNWDGTHFLLFITAWEKCLQAAKTLK